MADIYVVNGYIDVKELVTDNTKIEYVNDTNLMQFTLQSIFNKQDRVKVIVYPDISDVKFIKKVIKITKIPLLVMFPKGNIPKSLQTVFKRHSVTIMDGNLPDDLNVFQLTLLILKDIDRDKIFSLLSNRQSDMYMIFKLLLSEYINLSAHNQAVIHSINEYAVFRDYERFRYLLSYSIIPELNKKIVKYKFDRR